MVYDGTQQILHFEGIWYYTSFKIFELITVFLFLLFIVDFVLLCLYRFVFKVFAAYFFLLLTVVVYAFPIIICYHFPFIISFISDVGMQWFKFCALHVLFISLKYLCLDDMELKLYRFNRD